MKTRRIISLLCAISMVLSVTACGNKKGNGNNSFSETAGYSAETTKAPENTHETAEPDVDENQTTDVRTYAALDVIYEVKPDGTAEAVGYSGEGNKVTISSSYDGHDVVRIADSAFENCAALESVTLWADVKEIGDSAFKGCTGLKEFSIPSDTTRIGDHAFEGCSGLETLIVWGSPDIGEYAFANCISLTDISIGSDTKKVGAHAFEGCTGVDSLILWGAEIIGDYAFAGCAGIDYVSIPSDTVTVGNHAFDGCTALASVVVWNDDTAIGKDAFANCPNLTDAPAERGSVHEYTSDTTSSEQSAPAPNETSESEQQIENSEPQGENLIDGMRPEFKEAIDSYEDFFDEYCDFMKRYKEASDSLSLLKEYTEYLSKYSEAMEKMSALEDKEMNDAEMKYYLEAYTRINQKLIDAAL